MRRAVIALTGATLVGLAVSANAIPTGLLGGVGPGNSWVVTWHDATYNGETFDNVKFLIVNGGASGATFDLAGSVAWDGGTPTGWNGNLLNGTLTSISGPAVTKYGGDGGNMTLSFSGTQPSQNDIVVDVLYYNGNTFLPDLSWQWLSLPEYGYTEGVNWEYLTQAPPLPVPDGGLTAGLLGLSLVGLGGIRRLMRA